MTQRILFVGPTPALQRRLTLKSLTQNQVNRVAEVEVLAAGKAVNCARAAMRLGAEPEVLLFAGAESGQWLLRMLKAEGMLARPVETLNPTRTCSTLLESDSGAVTEIVENAAPVEPEAVERFIESFREALGGCWMTVFSGTIPPKAGDDFYTRLVAMATERGVPTLVDTQGDALIDVISAKPLLIKPNRKELAAATGITCNTDDGVREAIFRLHALGAHYVLVTDGGQPAWLSDRQTLTRFSPPWVEVKNPIGAGDTLTAGLAVSLVQGKPVTQAVRFGMACGSAAAAAEGYGRFEPRLAQALAERVRVTSEAL